MVPLSFGRTRLALADLHPILADVCKDSVPMGTYRPDSMHTIGCRIVRIGFNKQGVSTRYLSSLNALFHTSGWNSIPGQIKDADINWFTDFDGWGAERRERYAFEKLAAKGITAKWNWSTYDIMKQEPYRRVAEEARTRRLKDDQYRIPSFKDSNSTREENSDKRVALFHRLAEEIDRYSLTNKLIREYVGENSVDSCDYRYMQALYLSTAKMVDTIGNILDKEHFNWPEILNVKEETDRVKNGQTTSLSDALYPRDNVDTKANS
ncbi:hypothetical protein ASPWEDRAFT_23262 [Aspergillus wentii DTO 134E9]|uniref:Uncharacterized protein n=1 Tax=Aspergillus wentii DTO 134E9 TaxID=1073089 RepID=A0A1L9S1W6_ASPWE|nr:uncharacterized protein ASPWEDRAFT_23262 [Aspergillus wentii DTO 134E9]OJJ41154.1 hypothetical protein ASPWEDRAFT_23262 [Aspergillus wentii DTO 134E9]